MPQSSEKRTQSAGSSTLKRESKSDWEQGWDELFAAFIKQPGFTAALKSLNKGRLPTSEMGTVLEGVYEKKSSGLYDAALQTENGPMMLRNAQRTDRESVDPQLISSRIEQSFDVTADSDELTAEEILKQLTVAGAKAPCSLLCQVELMHFDPSQREAVLPLLWQYIIDHRNSKDCDELVAVGSAIRKYIAIMPMDRMGELAVLLEAGHRSSLPIDLELEVVKMIYRNFEVHPPEVADPHPELAKRLWEMVQAYINPRVLLRDKHSAATSLAIEAIVSMRSPLAVQACQAANTCPYRWFAELVSDDLDDLHDSWSSKSPGAAAWLRELQNDVFSRVI